MSTAYVVVSIAAAAWVAFSAVSVLRGAKWVVDSLAAYGVPRWAWPWLGVLKLAGAAGLLVGLVVPVIGLLAGIGLVLYFTGAVTTVLRARYFSHVPYPLLYLAPVVAALALKFAAGASQSIV
ncbi:MAG: DoxX family protein [Candidatus Dormibacteraeota bacterium]|nr:DoxX family protein [Candidatus Dormibacteraeota bacterium]